MFENHNRTQLQKTITFSCNADEIATPRLIGLSDGEVREALSNEHWKDARIDFNVLDFEPSDKRFDTTRKQNTIILNARLAEIRRRKIHTG